MTAAEDRLPALLVALTIVTGIIDAVSYLRLGHVFVANMTGNVVFLGFALAGARGIDPLASVTALLAFLAGARMAALTIARAPGERPRMLALVTTIKAGLLVGSVVLAAVLPIDEGAAARYILTAVLALAMGAQSAAAKHLAVADLTTTVLTMTLTALGAGGPGSRRRIIAVGAMFGGALVGGVIALRVGVPAALSVAATMMIAIAAIAWRT